MFLSVHVLSPAPIEICIETRSCVGDVLRLALMGDTSSWYEAQTILISIRRHIFDTVQGFVLIQRFLKYYNSSFYLLQTVTQAYYQ